MSKTIIQTATVNSSGITTIQFSPVPSGYDYLEISGSIRCSGTSAEMGLTFNTVSSNWSTRHLGAGGTSVFANDAYQPSRMYLGGAPNSNYTANSFSLTSIIIKNYASSSTNKLVTSKSIAESNNGFNLLNLVSGLWSNSAAVTSIQIFFTSNQDFAVGTTATLYGVTSGSDGTTTVS